MKQLIHLNDTPRQAIMRAIGLQNEGQWVDLVSDLGFWYLKSRKLPQDAYNQLRRDPRFWKWFHYIVGICTERFHEDNKESFIPLTYWWDFHKTTIANYTVNEAILKQVGNNFETWQKNIKQGIAQAMQAQQQMATNSQAQTSNYPVLNACADIYFCLNQFWKAKTGHFIFSTHQIDNGDQFLNMHMLLTYMTDRPTSMVQIPKKHWHQAFDLVALYFTIDRQPCALLSEDMFCDVIMQCNEAVAGYFGDNGQPFQVI